MSAFATSHAVVRFFVIAAFGLLPLSGEAAFYSGVFDPVDFAGTHFFFVDDFCLATDGFHQVNSGGDCGTVSILNNVTQLFDVTDVSHTSPQSTLTFAPQTSPIFEILVAGGDLFGVESNLIGPQPGTGSGPDFNGLFSIEYHDGRLCIDCILHFRSVELFQQHCGDLACGPIQSVASALRVTFVRSDANGNPLPIPEPGSLALLVAGSVAAWLGRRRRNRRRSAG